MWIHPRALLEIFETPFLLPTVKFLALFLAVKAVLPVKYDTEKMIIVVLNLFKIY